MKIYSQKLIQFIIIIICSEVLFQTTGQCQTSGDFRTIASGNWTITGNWETYNGSNWTSATHSPTHFDGNLNIQHTMIVNADLIINQTLIIAGVEISILPGVMVTVTNSTEASELIIQGSLLNSGMLFFSPGALMTVDSGGTYIHNTSISSSSVLDAAQLHSRSNWVYRGNGTLAPPVTFSNRHYGHLIFETSAGTWSRTISGSNPSSCTSLRIDTNIILINNYTGTFTIHGDLILYGQLSNGSGNQKIILDGSGNIIGGTNLNSFCDLLTIQNGASYQLENNITVATASVFSVFGFLDFTNRIVNGHNGNSTFTAASGAWLKTSHPVGITGAIVGFTFNNFSNEVSYEFSGQNSQDVTLFNSIVQNLKINTSPATEVTLRVGSLHILGTLQLTEGTFSIDSNTINFHGPAISGNSLNLSGNSLSSINYFGSDSGIFIPASIHNLKNLGINKTSHDVSMTNDLSIFGTLYLTKGNIFTETFQLLCEGGLENGIVGGSDSSYINGILCRRIPAGDSLTVRFPVGNTGFKAIQLSNVRNTDNTWLSVTASEETPSGTTDGVSLQGQMADCYWNLKVNGGNYLWHIGNISITTQNTNPVLQDSSKIGFSYNDSSFSYKGIGGTFSASQITSVWHLDFCQIEDLNSSDGSYVGIAMQGTTDAISIDSTCVPTLWIRLLIQGLYKCNGSMKAVANPFQYPAVCDSILITLHSCSIPYDPIFSINTTMDTSGFVQFDLPGAEGQNFYVSVQHRNSLETWSSVPITISDHSNYYDFSDSASKAYGNNLCDLHDGLYAIYSGDISSSSNANLPMQDGQINDADLSALENAMSLFLSGHTIYDLSGDNIAESADYSLLENNAMQNIHIARP